MSIGKIVIASVIASIAIFATTVIQSHLITVGGWMTTFTGSEILVAPAIVGSIVFVAVLGKLHTIHV